MNEGADVAGILRSHWTNTSAGFGNDRQEGARMDALTRLDKKHVHINVGGTLFETTLHTLGIVPSLRGRKPKDWKEFPPHCLTSW